MPRHRLRFLRVAVALVVLAAFTVAFTDFRKIVPADLGLWLASTQLVPSFVALATGALFSLGGVLVILLTLAVGRVYCSALCPLGILQDVISRIAARFRRQGKFLPHTRALTLARHAFLWGTAIAVLAGWGGLALALLDPYSNFGRIASSLVRPLLTFANNSVVLSAHALGFEAFNRIESPWPGVGVLLFPAALLTLIAVMSALRGRLYCNTVCPVGTLLGLISRHAAFRLRISQSACTKCAQCLRHCKAQCIDLRAGTIDASRCVACCDCIAVCDNDGIGYTFAWKTASASPVRTPPVSELAPDPQRRTFLASAATAFVATAVPSPLTRVADAPAITEDETPTLVKTGENSRAVSPPGAISTDRFLSRCTSCQLCVSACPTQVLRPAFFEYGLVGLLKPHLDYTASFCNFDCVRCADVCPTGAIDRLIPGEKQLVQIGVADFYRSRCVVVTNGTDCAACSEHCPTKAVSTEPYEKNLRLPVLHQDLCIGCGACEFACPVKPVKAIRVTGRRRHARARKLIEKKATTPTRAADFPF